MKPADLKGATVRARPSSGGNARDWYQLPTGGYVEAIRLRKLVRALPPNTTVKIVDTGTLLEYPRGCILLTGCSGTRLILTKSNKRLA